MQHKGKAELIRRYIVFLLGISIGALGVTLVTRSTLGVNSVACASYVTSVYFPVTMGQVTIAFNLFMMFSLLLIMTKEERRKGWINVLMQIPAFVVFGLLVDFFMFLTRDFHPENMNYLACLLTLCVGVVIIAINIGMQFIGNVAKLSCDAFVIELAQKINIKMGWVKLVYDVILVLIAAVMSLVCSDFTEIVGIREGTLVGAFCVGPMVQVVLPFLGFFQRWILRAQKDPSASDHVAVDPRLTEASATETAADAASAQAESTEAAATTTDTAASTVAVTAATEAPAVTPVVETVRK